MKTTLKILALLIALAIPAQLRAGYAEVSSKTRLVYKSEFTRDDKTTWGENGYIWQVCDWDYDSYWNILLNKTLEITLTKDITIVGPIYVPHNKILIIHTNGHSITPLQASQYDWTNTSLKNITNGAPNVTTPNYQVDFDGDGYNDAVVQCRDNVPLCSFFVEGQLYINCTPGSPDVVDPVPVEKTKVHGKNTGINATYYDGNGPDVFKRDVSGYNSANGYAGSFVIVSPNDLGTNSAGEQSIQTRVHICNLDVQYFGPNNIQEKTYASFLSIGTWLFKDNNVAQIVMDNVDVKNCYDDNDAGIILANYYNPYSYTPDCSHTYFTMNNCNISSCWAGGKTNRYGGVIKGYAYAFSKLTMNGCTMKNCISPAFGGAISWAPAGSHPTTDEISKLILNGCELSGNYARYMGGAICTEGLVSLKNTKILNNTAGYAGGGIAALPNTVGVSASSFGVELEEGGEGNLIKGNKTLFAHNNGGANEVRGDGVGLPTLSGEDDSETTFRLGYTIDGASTTNFPSGGGGIWVMYNRSGFEFSAKVNNATITENTSARAGGGVYVYKMSPANGTMNIALNANITKNFAASVGGGFAMGSNADEVPQISLTGGNISSNTAGKDGGGLFMPAGSFTMSGGNIDGNNATAGYGGGVAMGSTNTEFEHGTPVITLNAGSNIKNNTAGKDGGGIYVPAGTFTMEQGNITGNITAGYGGGVAMGDTIRTFGSFVPKFILKNGDISDNKSAFRGGGVFMPAGTFEMDGGNIYNNMAGYNNTATNDDKYKPGSGGGVGLMKSADGKLPVFTLNSGNIYNNTANNGNGGGVALSAGTVSISNCDIYGNIATTSLKFEDNTELFFNEKVRGSGGGIAMRNGTITVSGSSNIHTNECSKFGAGLYVYKTYSGDTPGDYDTGSSFTGGTFHDNGKSTTTPCLAGGGICVEGPVEFSFGANVESNQAYNGGGIALGAYAKMTYTGGHIRNNHAIHRPGTVNPTTGYNCRVYEIDGMGGGIFMGHHTELKFASGITNFGIYNNIAEHGADDIFANGLSSTVNLPEVKNMTLDELGLDKGQLFWVEDYVTDDTHYLYGTKVMDTAKDYPGTEHGAHLYKNWRYRYALNNEGYGFYDVDGGQVLTCYTSLALGYEIIYINIEKKGMKAGDSAMFKIASKNSDETYKDYMTVLLSYQTDRVPGSEATDASGVTTVTLKKRICLIGGYWRVAEVTNWSWAYDLLKTNLDTGSPDTITKTIKLSSTSSEDERTFTFENKYKSGIPKNDEGVKVNQIEPIE